MIPLKDREEWANDPTYKTCYLSGHFGHVCEGRITWEHAIIYAKLKVQKKWAVVPLCEKAHAVNRFQDAGTMIKELNEWIALSRATDEDILSLSGETSLTPLSKVKSVFQRKKYLIGKYGEWTYKAISPPLPSPVIQEKKNWKVMSEKNMEVIRRARDIFKEAEGRFYSDEQIIDIIFSEYSENLNLIKEVAGNDLKINY